MKSLRRRIVGSLVLGLVFLALAIVARPMDWLPDNLYKYGMYVFNPGVPIGIAAAELGPTDDAKFLIYVATLITVDVAYYWALAFLLLTRVARRRTVARATLEPQP